MGHSGAVKADMFNTEMTHVIFDMKVYVVFSADVQKGRVVLLSNPSIICFVFISIHWLFCFFKRLLQGFRASSWSRFLQQHLIFVSFLTLFPLSGSCFVLDTGFQQTWI